MRRYTRLYNHQNRGFLEHLCTGGKQVLCCLVVHLVLELCFVLEMLQLNL